MRHVIYDYETLATDVSTLPVVSLATLKFDPTRFLDRPYTFSELVDSCQLFKFDIQEQVKDFGRKIDKGCLEWWGQLPKEVRDSQLKPSKKDLSITELPDIMAELADKKTIIYTRGNTFDPVITDIYLRQLGAEHTYSPFNVRDTRSLIEGMTWGANIANNFIPEDLVEKFEAHNPAHDISMDVIRIQTLVGVLS